MLQRPLNHHAEFAPELLRLAGVGAWRRQSAQSLRLTLAPRRVVDDKPPNERNRAVVVHVEDADLTGVALEQHDELH